MTVEIPALSTIFASSTQTATDMFEFGWPYMVIGLGIFIGALLIVWFKDSIVYAFQWVFASDRERRYAKQSGHFGWTKEDEETWYKGHRGE